MSPGTVVPGEPKRDYRSLVGPDQIICQVDMTRVHLARHWLWGFLSEGDLNPEYKIALQL
jgi:hypothetical protein